MAARRGNKAWLRQQLAKALQWDAETTEGVVEAVATAGSQADVESLVEAYMGGDARARAAVQQFRGSGAAVAPAPPPPQPGLGPAMQLYQRDSGLQQVQNSLAARPSGSGGRGRPAAAAVESPAPTGTAKPVLDIHMGRNVAVTVKPARKKGSGGGGGSETAGAKSLARPVVNCLGCGKIFDCRTQSDAAQRFLASGGICTFCCRRVKLTYDDASTNLGDDDDEAAAAAATPGEGGSSSAGAGAGAGAGAADLAGFRPEAEQGNAADAVAYNASAAEALALKDRLVEYDRTAAKRTTVLDDQSDYFEIDTNAWLTDEERAVLKQREREMAEAEEARRRRVTVTVDLLGRTVILDSQDAGDGAEEEAALAAQLDAARAQAAARAAAATAAEAAQGGGAAAPTALAAVQERLRDLRITVSPSMAARHFVFLPQQAQQAQQAQQQQAQQQAQAQAAAPPGLPAVGGRGACGRGGRGRRQQERRARASDGISRLQHDDPFLELEAPEVPALAADEAGRRAPRLAAGAS